MKGRRYIYDKATGKMVEITRRPAAVHRGDDLAVKILPYSSEGFFLGVAGNGSDPRDPAVMNRVLDKADQEAERHPRRECVRYQDCFDRLRDIVNQ